MRAQRHGEDVSWVSSGKGELTDGDHSEKSDKYPAVIEKKDLGPEMSGHIDPIHQVYLSLPAFLHLCREIIFLKHFGGNPKLAASHQNFPCQTSDSLQNRSVKHSEIPLQHLPRRLTFHAVLC